jgi:hypothetical protein
MYTLRKLPPVCLVIALVQLITGRLRFSDKYLGAEVKNEDGSIFRVFRNIKTQNRISSPDACVFVVSFKFARLSHKANKMASIIPMLLIAGFPGFIQKLYAWDPENGHWQGIYEWDSIRYLEAYKRSFVFRTMNRRAIEGTVQANVRPNVHLSDFMDGNVLSKNKSL